MPRPAEAKIIYSRTNLFGHLDSRHQPAFIQDNGKLIATQAGQRVGPTNLGAKDIRQLTQQLIPCRMTTAVINYLELIQIHETKTMLRPFVAGRIDVGLQLIFELSTIE